MPSHLSLCNPGGGKSLRATIPSSPAGAACGSYLQAGIVARPTVACSKEPPNRCSGITSLMRLVARYRNRSSSRKSQSRVVTVITAVLRNRCHSSYDRVPSGSSTIDAAAEGKAISL
jgi:hypothetical protein